MASEASVLSVRPRALAPAMVLQYAVGGAFLPFLTLYYRQHGLSYSQIGSIQAVSAVFQSTMPLLWGVLADRVVPVNRLLTVLHFAGSLALLAFSYQADFTGLLLVAVAWHAFGAPTFALMNALSYHNLRSPREEFGSLRLWGSIGWMLPSLPVWCWLTFRDDASLQFVFVLAAASALGFVALSAFLPHTPPAARRGDPERPRKPFVESLRVLITRPGFAVLLIVHVLMFWSFNMILYYSPFVLEARGVEKKWYGLIQCIGVTVEIPLFFLLRRLLRRLGHVGTLAVGCAIICGRQLVFAYVTEPAVLIVSFLLVGMGVVFYLIPISLTVDALADREVRATAQAMLLLAGPGLGGALGHLISGPIADRGSGDVTSVFVVAAGVALAAFALLPIVWRLERRSLAS